MSQASFTPASKPAVAMICNSLPPYRVHVQERIAREFPQIQLWTLCTHEGQDARWGFDPPQSIHPVSFGRKEGVPDEHRMNLASYRKGGEVIEWMRQHDIRAVVVFGYNDACRVRVIRWCHKNGVPCLVWGDSNILGDFARGLKRIIKHAFVRKVLSWSWGALACGSLGREYFERYGVPTKRIFYFTNEPDYQLITGMSPDRIGQAMEKFNLAPHRRRMVFSGRLIAAKRPDLLVKAFCAIAEKRPTWDLLMVGNGVMQAELEAMVPPNLRSRVVWTGFLNDQSDVSALYRASDLLVLPSNYEPWALVINEAAAAEMAIVSSNVVGASAELVRDGINGKLFAAGDLRGLIDSLLFVTAEERIESLKAASPAILQQWRIEADPVEGLREALERADVIAPPR